MHSLVSMEKISAAVSTGPQLHYPEDRARSYGSISAEIHRLCRDFRSPPSGVCFAALGCVPILLRQDGTKVMEEKWARGREAGSRLGDAARAAHSGAGTGTAGPGVCSAHRVRWRQPRRDPAEVNAWPSGPPPPPRPSRPERRAPARVFAAQVPVSGSGRRSWAGAPCMSSGVTECGSGLQGGRRMRNRGCRIHPLPLGNRGCAAQSLL